MVMELLSPQGAEVAPRAVRGEDEIFELANRKNYQLEVTLYWLKQSNILGILINDYQRNTQAIFPVPNDKGLDAFYHPYAYIGDVEEKPRRRRKLDKE